MTSVYVVELCKDERITADTWAHVGEIPREIYIPMENRYLAAAEHAMREHGITPCRSSFMTMNQTSVTSRGGA